MNTPSTYALLAAGAYWDVRTLETNRAPIAPGWKLLDEFSISSSGANSSLRKSGLSARVYQAAATNEIVISFAGTEFDSNTAGTIVDFFSGNIPLAFATDSSQAHEAALLYERVQRQFGASADITFTGHSLGGGLASLLAVWFNRKAIVFDPAPFKTSAIDRGMTSVMSSVRSDLSGYGFIDDQLNQYLLSPDFAKRQSQVTSYAIEGEVLELIPQNLFARIEGSRTELLTGAAPNLSHLDKHGVIASVVAAEHTVSRRRRSSRKVRCHAADRCPRPSRSDAPR